ncbi:hypothetical protein [Spirosoma foliorum]|uniref:DUF4185 domain-containing protein n=1 Tax=Spirosoma foliorum TaxID=2710596 RepID=A0A7G5GTE6_9BACT|nr:hypothetical protein [Spirosoma foliorum]QMW02138.1 hypothetical protein H3H32_30075 [Spirosoma foliorum]
MKPIKPIVTRLMLGALTCSVVAACSGNKETQDNTPNYKLIPAKKVLFNSFVDCNMAEAWVGDTFRIFPGKYGEDPLWGNARDLKYADGRHAEEAFASKASDFREPSMPKNAPVNVTGLHGAVWFETVYQDSTDKSGKTLYAVYHNENYPATLPYNASTGEGYKNEKWPQGITGPTSPAAVCRIGIMKSVNGGKVWENKGIFIEDLQARMILKPHNTSKTFAGGVGDPSAVANGGYLYLFYGEYGYPGQYNEKDYNPQKEWSGQCISVARISLTDLDNPVGKARRWDGKGFNAPYNGVGAPIKSLQIPPESGGGAASSPTSSFHWGPSVSWNTYLNCWVMLMGKATGPSWAGSSIHISFNTNKDLGEAIQSQAWTKPALLLDKPGYFLWYPSLQPMNTPDDISNKYTCLRLGQRARLFVKNIQPKKSEYMSEYMIEFVKSK